MDEARWKKTRHLAKETAKKGKAKIRVMKGTHVTGQVLLFAQDRLVRVELRIESFEELRGNGIIGRASEEPIQSHRNEPRTKVDTGQHRIRTRRVYGNKLRFIMNSRAIGWKERIPNNVNGKDEGYARLEHLLENELRRARIEVLHLDAHSLLELRVLREVGGRGQEGRLRALSGVLDCDVTADSAGFIENEAIVVLHAER